MGSVATCPLARTGAQNALKEKPKEKRGTE